MFSTISSRGNDIHDFLFASVDDGANQKKGLLTKEILLYNLFPLKSETIQIQSNFSGSNTFGTTKISSKQG